MKVINLSKQKTLSLDAKEAVSLKDKLLGLLDKKNPRTLIFYTRFGIHTFFLTQSIDVIVLDNNCFVKKVRSNLKPKRLFFWQPRFNRVIELPQGTIKKTFTRVGDRLRIC